MDDDDDDDGDAIDLDEYLANSALEEEDPSR
jgi:hypothetical protein